VFGTIFEVNSRIVKLWDLLGHFNEEDTVDFLKYQFFVRQLYNVDIV